MASKVQLSIQIKTQDENFYTSFQSLLLKIGNLLAVDFIKENSKESYSKMLGKDTLYIVNLEKEEKISPEQIEELKKKITHYEGFLKSVEKKLSNSNFIERAQPDIIELEKKKKEDTIKILNSLKIELNEKEL